MFDLALHQKDAPVTLKEISGRQQISLDYLEHIFITLRKAGLVKSKMGLHGGFMLAKESSRIKVIDIVTALDGEIALVECLVEEAACQRAELCVIRLLWKRLSSQIMETLSSITLSDLLKEAEKVVQAKNVSSYEEYLRSFLAN
jgi:Rrf2 family protein